MVDAYLRQHPPIPGQDRDDLYQEARIAWFRAESSYRPDRGASRRTYIGTVVENRLRDIARQARATRRGSGRTELSLDMPAAEDGDALRDLLADDAPQPHAEAERSELIEVLERMRGRLPLRQRHVLDALAQDRPRTEIALGLGISRDTLYEDIRRIQNACRDEGLEDFLT